MTKALLEFLDSGERPTLRSTARLMNTSPRTLQRHLDARGVTFSALLTRAESQSACQMLRNTKVPIRDISTALGYRDPSSFSRAFRLWTGASPRQFRRACHR